MRIVPRPRSSRSRPRLGRRLQQAEGEAKSNVARARGDASANRLRQRSLTPRLIQCEAIQKLNPNVQIIVCPPQSVCIPNSGCRAEPRRQLMILPANVDLLLKDMQKLVQTATSLLVKLEKKL